MPKAATRYKSQSKFLEPVKALYTPPNAPSRCPAPMPNLLATLDETPPVTPL